MRHQFQQRRQQFVQPRHYARTFNSTSDLITCTTGASFPNAAGSLFFWFKPTWNSGDSASHVLFDHYSSATSFLRIQKFSDNNFYCGWFTSSVDYRATAAASGFSSGAWSKVFMTWDDTANETRFYVDNVSKATNLSSLVTFSANVNITLGNANGGGADAAGDMAEFALWNRVLTSGERGALQNGDSPDNVAGDWVIYRSLRHAAMWTETNVANATHPTVGGSPPIADVRSGTQYDGDVFTGTMSAGGVIIRPSAMQGGF